MKVVTVDGQALDIRGKIRPNADKSASHVVQDIGLDPAPTSEDEIVDCIAIGDFARARLAACKHVAFPQYEALDEIGSADRQFSGDRAAHGVPHDSAFALVKVIENCGGGIGMTEDRKSRHRIAVARTWSVYRDGASARQRRVGHRGEKIGNGRKADAREPDEGRVGVTDRVPAQEGVAERHVQTVHRGSGD